MTTKHEAWLALTLEDPMNPDLPICDPHHHLWDFTRNHVPDYAIQVPRYLLEELLEDIGGGHNIVRTVFLECQAMYRKAGSREMQPIGETEFVQGIAAQSASGQYGTTNVAAGIVGFADLTLGAKVAPVLEAHMAASRNRFRGIRYISTWDANSDIIHSESHKGVLLDPKFREGFAYLNKYELSFDAGIYHTQLMELVDLARAFPDTPIIVNHTSIPIGIGPYAGKREEVLREWKHGIAALGSYHNVFMKLGGLGMAICGFGWHERTIPPSSAELAEAMAPYYLWCIEQFGADRCMFESNFPVDKMSYSYTVLWNAFKRISEDFSPEKRSALFHDTAVRAYRLAASHK